MAQDIPASHRILRYADNPSRTRHSSVPATTRTKMATVDAGTFAYATAAPAAPPQPARQSAVHAADFSMIGVHQQQHGPSSARIAQRPQTANGNIIATSEAELDRLRFDYGNKIRGTQRYAQRYRTEAEPHIRGCGVAVQYAPAPGGRGQPISREGNVHRKDTGSLLKWDDGTSAAGDAGGARMTPRAHPASRSSATNFAVLATGGNAGSERKHAETPGRRPLPGSSLKNPILGAGGERPIEKKPAAVAPRFEPSAFVTTPRAKRLEAMRGNGLW